VGMAKLPGWHVVGKARAAEVAVHKPGQGVRGKLGRVVVAERIEAVAAHRGRAALVAGESTQGRRVLDCQRCHGRGQSLRTMLHGWDWLSHFLVLSHGSDKVGVHVFELSYLVSGKSKEMSGNYLSGPSTS
jgi:hypothetical protein